MDIHLIAYPRSAKHWFKWYIENNTDLSIETIPYSKKAGSQETEHFNAKFNQIPNLDNTMAIIRRPEESLASIYTMESLQNIEYRSQQYIDYYEFIIGNVRHIFKFEDVISSPASIAEYFCKINDKSFNSQFWQYAQYEQWYLQTQDKRKLITSKTNELYDRSKSIVQGMDLSIHNDLYDKALYKCVRI